MSIGTAFRAFFAALFDREKSIQLRLVLDGKSASKISAKDSSVAEASHKPPQKKVISAKRSDAVALMSTLQREARLLDLIMESLDEYSNEQVGAAARDVLRDSKKTLSRVFEIQPLVPEQEGDSVEIPADASPDRFRMVGSSGNRGQLTHAGWMATKVELGNWTGKREDANVIAPAEIEIS